jgi:hypothetical protein
MTTFDEEMFKRALREAAEEFAISARAKESILEGARDSDDDDAPSRIRTFVENTGRLRSSVMAAAACVVVLAVAVPLFNAEATTNATSAHSAVRAAPRGVTGSVAGASAQTLGEGPVVIQGTGQSDVHGTAFTEFTNTSATTVTKQADTASLDGSLRVEEVGTIFLTVGDQRFESTLTQLTDFATTDGGFVASTQSHMGKRSSHTYSTGSIVLQVPEHNFTMLVDQVRHAGDATSVVTSAADVTGQYVDLQARISALQVSRTQYLKIMSRTNSIGGILSVQEQLNSIQSQIEQLQAQLNLLNSETTYASLTVSVSEAGHPVHAPAHPRTGVNKAWHESLHGFAAGFEWLIRIAGPLLFALLVLAALLALGRLTWRTAERRRSRIG